jgi:hypothetical protein
MEMESPETPKVQELEVARSKKRGIWPAMALVFAAPLVAEFLLGNLPIRLLPALVILAPMYGGGALLIREVVRRTGRGWPSILLLGMAYAIVEEAFTTQSLFNPDYLRLNLGLLAPGYIPALGIGAWWTLWMLNVHAVWSISTPIALIEACVPERARTPWLGRVGLVVVATVFLAGATAGTLMSYKQEHFLASVAQFIGAAVVVLLFALAAFAVPKGRGDLASGEPTSPWIVGGAALAFGSAALLVPMGWGWGAVAGLLVLDIAILLPLVWLARRRGWGLMQQMALGAGAALAYGWHAFLQPALGGADASVRVGNAIFLIGAIVLIWLAAKRTSASGR